MIAQRVEMQDEPRPEDFSDFNFWRRPASPSHLLGMEVTPTEDPGDAEQFNDFCFWSMPPPDPTALGVVVDGQTEGDSEMFDSERPNMAASEQPEDPHDHNDSNHDDSEGFEMINGEDHFGSLVASDAGSRLLGILGRLSQHLGSHSRFSRAAGQLQGDFLQARQQVLRASQVCLHSRVPPCAALVASKRGAFERHGYSVAFLCRAPPAESEPADGSD